MTEYALSLTGNALTFWTLGAYALGLVTGVVWFALRVRLPRRK